MPPIIHQAESLHKFHKKYVFQRGICHGISIKTPQNPYFCTYKKISGDRLRIVNGIKNKNIKNSLGAMWNASHLAV